ncbi:hypothetical protein ACLOJK_032765 [Asimina triloba]
MELSDEISTVENPSRLDDGDDTEAEPRPADDEAPAPIADSVVDISNRSLEMAIFNGQDDSAESLYVYKNVFNLVPKSLGSFRRLKALKFFANEIELFPPEAGDLVDLECLQVKVASPALSRLELRKMAALKELELCHVPPRPSMFSMLGDIAVLKSLTKLSICHFSIRHHQDHVKILALHLEETDVVWRLHKFKLEFLPPQIGCLTNLEDLDLSFNKLKNLPDDIASLTALRSLRVANNKLVELPSDIANDEFISSSVEVDLDAAIRVVDARTCCGEANLLSSSLSAEPSSNSRSSATRRMRKGWKRRDYLQQKARQERLNTSRKLRNEDRHELTSGKMDINCNPCKQHLIKSIGSESHCHVNEEEQPCSQFEPHSASENEYSIVGDLNRDGCELAGEHDCQVLPSHAEEDDRNVADYGYDGDDCSCIDDDSLNKECDCRCKAEHCAASASHLNNSDEQDVESSSEASKNMLKSKRHSDSDLDSPKPRKFRRPVHECLKFTFKYSTESFCGSNDRMPDGFYDAGRDRPFMPLHSYEQSLPLSSREVILVDRKRDEELDAIVLTTQMLMSSLKLSRNTLDDKEDMSVDNLQRASVLALFVSSCFGGSDRSSSIATMRRSVAHSNYQKPFICSCSTGNNYDGKTSSNQLDGPIEDVNFADLCENSLRFMKETRNSNVVPIGSVRFGVCRHRAVLMKYLCDRADPPIPCELVRGYLDFRPHAWNIILVRKGELLVRTLVDACHPTDIREEMDTEYFCRYIPLTRLHFPISNENFVTMEHCFPVSPRTEAANAASGSIIQCKLGGRTAAAKLRILEVNGDSDEEMKKFEFSCLGEVRLLNALRNHNCVVEIYGHRLSSKWVVPPVEGNKGHRQLQSVIMMEYISGGSLKNYIGKLLQDGAKHVPVSLALFIARDIASALTEVHLKDIVHRDIKSENILLNLDSKRNDGTPIVKLCDFDRAVPLKSPLHTCCIAHLGIPPPDACVGTPRWMAPEVLRTMHTRSRYGLSFE